jgi:RNA polymerase sigma-70 factor, ECF subfamily
VEHRRRVLGRLRQSLTTEEQSLLALRIDLRLPWNEIAEVLVLEGKPVDPNTLM